MKFARMSLPTRGWEKKMCGFCCFSLLNSFAVFKVRAYVKEVIYFLRYLYFIMFAVFCSYSPPL